MGAIGAGKKQGHVKMVERQKKTERWKSKTRSREDQYDQRRKALILEAGRAFAKKGFHNTSLDEVAEALNVTKPALYYYIRTKQEILFECHNLTMDIAQRAKEYSFARSEDPLERFRLFLTKYITTLASEFGAHAILLEPISSLKEDQREFILNRRRGFDHLMRSLLDQCIAQGKIRPCETSLAVNFFMGAVAGIPRWFNANGPLSGEEIAAAYLDFIFQGLAPKA